MAVSKGEPPSGASPSLVYQENVKNQDIHFYPYFFTLFCRVDEKDILLRVFLTLRDILPFTVQMRTQNHHFEPDTS